MILFVEMGALKVIIWILLVSKEIMKIWGDNGIISQMTCKWVKRVKLHIQQKQMESINIVYVKKIYVTGFKLPKFGLICSNLCIFLVIKLKKPCEKRNIILEGIYHVMM